jgi:NADPH:quinone reductase-like Zn-dependent oxidoreductase
MDVARMKAALYRRYGPPEVVHIEELERPVPGDGEVLVAVRAASVNPLDGHFMRGRPWIARLAFGIRRPRLTRPGADFAGVVEAVGAGVGRFRPGDAVFGTARGAFADFVCAAEAKLAAKPAALSFEQAAALPVAGLTALQGLRDQGRLKAGQNVLIVGAGGGIGTFAVQIAKAMGARVTGVCSRAKLGLVRSIGADRVIDYGEEDVLRSGERFDLVFDLAATRSFRAWRRVLAPGGMLIAAGMAGGGGELGGYWLAGWAVRTGGGLLLSRFVGETLRLFIARIDPADLAALAALVEAGKVTPVIDRLYSLADVPAAIRRLAGGQALGKVVVTMEA